MRQQFYCIYQGYRITKDGCDVCSFAKSCALRRYYGLYYYYEDPGENPDTHMESYEPIDIKGKGTGDA